MSTLLPVSPKMDSLSFEVDSAIPSVLSPASSSSVFDARRYIVIVFNVVNLLLSRHHGTDRLCGDEVFLPCSAVSF